MESGGTSFFEKNGCFEAISPQNFEKEKGVGRMKNLLHPLLWSRWNSVRKPGEGFVFQVPFVRTVRTDGLDIPLDVPYQLFAAEIRVAEKFLAKVYCHRHVDFAFVFVPRFLRNLNFPANAVAKIEHRQMGVYLLKNEFICPVVKVQQTYTVFRKPNICFDFPSHMV